MRPSSQVVRVPSHAAARESELKAAGRNPTENNFGIHEFALKSARITVDNR
jgi:hypothetical protein